MSFLWRRLRDMYADNGGKQHPNSEKLIHQLEGEYSIVSNVGQKIVKVNY